MARVYQPKLPDRRHLIRFLLHVPATVGHRTNSPKRGAKSSARRAGHQLRCLLMDSDRCGNVIDDEA